MVKKHTVLPQYRRNTATGAYGIRLGKACMTIMSITGISSGPAAQSVRRWIPSLALVIAGTVLTVTSTLAAPLAGTVIRAQALASYDLAGSAGPEKVSSNTVIAIIQPVRALTLTQDNNLPRPAASTVTFAHVLTNKGNVAENYIFAVDQTGCTTPNLGFQAAPALYVDVNGNGIADPNDRKLTLGASAALSLAPGESANVLLQERVPLAANGGRSCVRLVATAEAGKWGATPISAQNLDTVLITSNASVVLTKSVNYSGLAVPGSTVLTYTVTANNIGNNDAGPTDTVPTPGSILVDGRPRALVMIRDKVPTGTQYVAGSLQTAVAGALRLFRLASDAPFSYHSEPAPVMGIASGRDDSSAVEVAIGLPVSLPRNASVSMGFRARLLATAGAEIKNTAWADFNDGASPAESGSNTVTVHATSAALGLSKAASVPVVNMDAHGVVDGTATVRFQLLARNFGTNTLYDVGMSDLLENVSDGLQQYTTATLPGAGLYTVVANSVRVESLTGVGTAAAPAFAYTGQAAHSDLLSSGAVLPPGGSVTVQFDVRFSLSGLPAKLFNSASAHAPRQSNGPVVLTVQSSNGLDPDRYRTGIPNPPGATSYLTQLPVMELVNTVSTARPVPGAKNTYDVDIVLKVTNVGQVEVPNVRLADNLFCAFQMDQSGGAVQSWQITEAPKAKNGLLTPLVATRAGRSVTAPPRPARITWQAIPLTPVSR